MRLCLALLNEMLTPTMQAVALAVWLGQDHHHQGQEMNAVSSLMGGTEHSYYTGYTSLMGGNERLGKEFKLPWLRSLWLLYGGWMAEDG